MDSFWAMIDNQLEEIRRTKADTFEAVSEILGGKAAASSGDAFFAGSGGANISEALREAGWEYVWMEAGYHYAMRHPRTGATLTYVEGDLYSRLHQPA